MLINYRPRVALALCCALAAPLAAAEAPHQLLWEDLVPKPAAGDNPFSRLTREQLLALSAVAAYRDRKLAGDQSLSARDSADEQATEHKLEQAGLDVELLLSRRKEIAEQTRARNRAVNAALNGQVVRLPGYLLPLEFSGKRVTEFLLVPWVGACIHTPPPPPNQIVHVKTGKPFEMQGIFMPVWVTGQLATGATKQSLYLIDGTSDIDVGYSLQASEVEPYKE